MRLTSAMRDFLEERRFAVLATLNPDGSAQQSVMWFELRGDTIIMNTSAGRVKNHNMRRDRRISICIEDHYRYLTIAGTISEIIDDQEIAQADILALARRYNPDASDEEINRSYSNFRREQRVTVVLPIEHVVANGF